MSDTEVPPEAALVEGLRAAVRPTLSVRTAAQDAGISEGRWRQIAKGYNQATRDVRVPVKAPADTLARMARTVRATPAQLRDAGREDAAVELEELLRSGGSAPQTPAPPQAPQATVPTPYDGHFERAKRLLHASHTSIRTGDHLGAIHGLEGAWSTVELLVNRLTDDALLKGIPNADQPDSLATSPEPAAPPEGRESQKTKSPDDTESKLSDYMRFGEASALDAVEDSQ